MFPLADNANEKFAPFLSGGHSVTEPPESIPNSAVKRNSGDGSVGLPHVRVAHRQAPNLKKGYRKVALFYCVEQNLARAFYCQYENALAWTALPIGYHAQNVSLHQDMSTIVHEQMPAPPSMAGRCRCRNFVPVNTPFTSM